MSEEKSTHPGPRRKPLKDRFLLKIGPPDGNGCWPWLGCKNSKLYGLIGKGGKEDGMIKAHRASWEIFNNPIPETVNVLHRCDNPSCVNPAHLFLGSLKDNSQDMVEKGRHGATRHPEKIARGERSGKAKLTEEMVREIKRLREKEWIPRRLAYKFQVSTSAIRHILRGRTWKHVE